MSANKKVSAGDFQTLFEAAPGAYLVLAPDLTIVAATDAYLRATRTVRESIAGRDVFEVFPDNPNDPKATGVANSRRSFAHVLKHGTPDVMAVQKHDIRRPESEGGEFEERHWSPVNAPVFVDGQVKFILHSVEDVTEYVRLEQQGSRREKLARELQTRAEHMEAEIYRRAQMLQDANRELRDLQADLESRVAARTADLQAANAELQREIQERKRAEDALRETETQLRQSQKLEAVGQLAGGVAHDFNNLLSVILGYSEMVREAMSSDDGNREHIDECIAAAQRAATLTRQLLAFSRKQIIEPKVVDLNLIVAETERMLRRLIGEDIDLVARLEPDLGRIRVDPGQMEQVIVNLVVNARDAMANGGRLTIETANVDLDEGYVRRHLGTATGPHVMLAISDTGVGMDEQTLSRIFEPFFTTKEFGKGTGLGLATVYGIVKQSGGSIWVYSEPGQGSTFKVYFPIVDAGAESAQQPQAAGARDTGTETILLVEDDAALRRLVKVGLIETGYNVLEARDPRHALELASSAHVDLVLTDVVMPGMSGKAMSDVLAEVRPDLPVLFMSGYTDDSIVHHGILGAGLQFLQKPFTTSQLRKKIRESLRSRVPAPLPAKRSRSKSNSV